MCYSYITTLAILVYDEMVVVFADISNPYKIIFNIIEWIRPIDEWAEIAFSGCQYAENEHCDIIK